MLSLLELLDRIRVSLQLRVGERKLLVNGGILGANLHGFFKVFRGRGGLSLTESELAEPFESIEILRSDAQ